MITCKKHIGSVMIYFTLPTTVEGKSDSGGTPNWDIKLPERKSIEVGRYTVPSMKDLENEIVLPLNGTQVNNIQMKVING